MDIAMMPDEKDQLLALLHHAGSWCRHAEAHNADGQPVHYDDQSAVAWDITGALCLLFGWHRAGVLFTQLERHLVGKRPTVGWPVPDSTIEAMTTLQEFNDRKDLTFSGLREQIETIPSWNSGRREKTETGVKTSDGFEDHVDPGDSFA